MNIDETKAAIAVMQAYVDGKEIEYTEIGEADWCVTFFPAFNWNEFTYRVEQSATNAKDETTMTKPFNPTKPCKTRDGRKVRIICTDATFPTFPIVALVGTGGSEERVCYTADGRYHSVTTRNCGYDLINTPKTIEGWVNVVPDNFGWFGLTKVFPTRESADNVQSAKRRIACVHISFEEGEGL